MSYDEILGEAIDNAVAVEASNATVRKGQAAARELSLIEGLIKSRTHDLVTALIDCDPTEVDTLRVLAIGLRALRDLHNYLAQTSMEGMAAAHRLQEPTSQGDKRR